jgi:hypothetical protein
MWSFSQLNTTASAAPLFLLLIGVGCLRLCYAEQGKESVLNVVLANPLRDAYNISIHYNATILVSELVLPICTQHIISYDSCNEIMDALSFRSYGVYYTPTRQSSTLDDHSATPLQVMQYTVDLYNRPHYLEIGCAEAEENFGPIRDLGLDVALCVDPKQGGTHRMTSDDFFLQNNLMFDIIFIDGLHTGMQVYKDVFNALRFLNEDGIIFLHDCNPRIKRTQVDPDAKVERVAWTGDVWRAAVALRLMEGIEIVVGDFDYGVGAIRRRQNKHKLSMEWEMKLLQAPIDALTYEEFAANKDTLLRMVSFAELKLWVTQPS